MDEFAECWMVLVFVDDVQTGPPSFYTRDQYEKWDKSVRRTVTPAPKVKIIIRKYEMSGLMIGTHEGWEEI
jgi:hypothetical protein